ncbi:hypothetical protein HAZT_HAZT009769 [Hyalella azteca]|uniref:Deltamethrin resistance protein prag01 domain-containing protein n=1 Tax=Hyalella azteca TaxID=294128 RepID=A0A6A0GSN8_HYAAZ|nr:hypothetical protein HAZT_HAZT009769 [Hyalella azteca]
MGRRGMAGYGLTHVKPPTMNDLPVPSGSWQVAYAQTQSKYNMILLGSAIFCAATLTFAKVSQLIKIEWGPAYKD